MPCRYRCLPYWTVLRSIDYRRGCKIVFNKFNSDLFDYDFDPDIYYDSWRYYFYYLPYWTVL